MKQSSNDSMRNPLVYFSIILIVGGLLLHALTYTRYPLVDCDEGWYASTAFNLLQNGSFGMPIFNNFLNVGENYSGFGRLFVLMQAGIFKILGVGYWQARFLSIIGIAVTTFFTYYTGKKLYNARVGILAALLTVFAWDTFSRGHIARPEIWFIAACLAVLTVFWRIREQPTLKSGLMFGFVATLPMNLHPNGILFLLAFGVLCLMEFGLKKHQWLKLIAFGAGAAAGGLLWLALHLLPDIALSYRQWSGLGQSPVEQSAISLITGFLAWLLDYHWNAYGGLAMIQAVYFLIAIGLAVRFFNPAHKAIIIVVGISLLAFIFLKTGKQAITSLIWIPFLILLLSGSMDQLAHQLHEKLTLPMTPSWLHLFLLLPLLIVYIVGDVWLIYKYRDYDYDQVAAQIEQDIPENAHVTAQESWWFGIAPEGHPFLSDSHIHQMTRFREAPLDDADFEALNLDIVILDDELSCYGIAGTGYPIYHEYVVHHCQPIEQFEIVTYAGRQESTIYQCQGANTP